MEAKEAFRVFICKPYYTGAQPQGVRPIVIRSAIRCLTVLLHEVARAHNPARWRRTRWRDQGLQAHGSIPRTESQADEEGSEYREERLDLPRG